MSRIFVVLTLIAVSSATAPVRQCDTENPVDDLKNRIDLGNCTKLPCRLKKDTFLNLTIKFKPGKTINGLKNHVTAEVLGAKVPFVGVDGEDACPYIFKADGSKVSNCNLKADQDYVFKNGIEVLRIYPRIKTIVHWALVSSDGKDVICFEVPVRITN